MFAESISGEKKQPDILAIYMPIMPQPLSFFGSHSALERTKIPATLLLHRLF